MAATKTKTKAAPEGARRKLGRPKGEKEYRPVKLEAPLAAMAKVVATARGVPIGVFLGEIAGDAIRRAYGKVVAGREV